MTRLTTGQAETRRYAITRTVVEYIEVEAQDNTEADVTASESPLDDWDRDIKESTVEDITGDGKGGPIGR